MAQQKYLIIVAGPTAIGKTALSIELAKRYDAEIISSDSRQYYKELSIGTAKPSKTEQHGIHHHFIDSLSIHDKYSIGQFERDVIDRLDTCFQERDVMIMTGGSGMHIRAITHGLDDFPDVPSAVREKWEAVFDKEGLEPLRQAIRDVDPVYAASVDMNNSRRLIRALAVSEVGGQPFSSYLNQPAKQRAFTAIYILLERDRSELYDRINLRVDQMLENGLEEEARSLYAHKGLQALQTIGYKELFDYFDGKTDRSKAIELIKRNSRRYAKRQMTWFRKEDYWERVASAEYESVYRIIEEGING